MKHFAYYIYLDYTFLSTLCYSKHLGAYGIIYCIAYCIVYFIAYCIKSPQVCRRQLQICSGIASFIIRNRATIGAKFFDGFASNCEAECSKAFYKVGAIIDDESDRFCRIDLPFDQHHMHGILNYFRSMRMQQWGYSKQDTLQLLFKSVIKMTSGSQIRTRHPRPGPNIRSSRQLKNELSVQVHCIRRIISGLTRKIITFLALFNFCLINNFKLLYSNSSKLPSFLLPGILYFGSKNCTKMANSLFSTICTGMLVVPTKTASRRSACS